jgi:hypothetical protein
VVPRRERPRRSSSAQAGDPYTLLVALNASGAAEGHLYEDDGLTTAHQQGAFVFRTFTFADGTLRCVPGRGSVSRRAAERRHPTGRSRTGSPTLQKLQDPILLLPWVCFRGGGFPSKPRRPKPRIEDPSRTCDRLTYLLPHAPRGHIHRARDDNQLWGNTSTEETCPGPVPPTGARRGSSRQGAPSTRPPPKWSASSSWGCRLSPPP